MLQLLVEKPKESNRRLKQKNPLLMENDDMPYLVHQDVDTQVQTKRDLRNK